jgi:tellurite resistance protein
MPSFLFETGPDPRRVDRGTFSCPRCAETRRYTRIAVRRSLNVIGLSVPFGTYGEYIECTTCLATYRPEVLACDVGADAPRVLAEYERALKRVLALLVITDGRIDDAEVATVQRIFEAVCGETLSTADVIAEAKLAAREPMTAARFLAQIVGHLNDYGKEQVLRGAALVSHADGSLEAREANMVRRLAAVMHLDPARLDDLLLG